MSAIAQYAGATIAILLFDEVAPETVAWLRVAAAAVVLILVSPERSRVDPAPAGRRRHLRDRHRVDEHVLLLGLARTDLGKSVAIEFIGPIAVAAAMTKTARNGAALALAAAGVVVLGGLEVGDNTVGLLWILAASAMWALYIVVGSRVAQIGRGVAGLGIGLAIGAVVITPIGAPGSADVFTTPRLLAGCVLVGVFSNAIGYGIDQHVLRRIPVRRFSVLLALLPVTAVVFGWLGLDQVPSAVEFAGIALVLAGVVLQERDELPLPAQADAP